MSGLRLGQKMRERLREERERLNVSTRELALDIFVDPDIWEQIEAGRVPCEAWMYLSLKTVGVDVTYVFNGWREEVVTPIFRSVRGVAS
jgi:hypothetical protein